MGWLARKRRRKSFPDYAMLDRDGIVGRHVGMAEERTRKLERIYHLSQQHAWDGRAVLSGLIAKHGGIQLPMEQRESLAKIFSIILWGELAAWIVSADLAEKIDDVEAKMAATSQTFDEARHFYVMRDYLLALGVPIPRLDAYTRWILRELLATEDVIYKLVGMQLLVENAALSLFKMIARARVEPVLTELLPYFEKDEARHVGLGITYLPVLLKDIGPLQMVRLNAFQARIYALLFWDTMLLIDDFDRVGLDANDSTRFSLRLQLDIATQMGKFSRGADAKGARGVWVEPEVLRQTHSFSVDAFLPHPGAEIPPWQRGVLRVARGVARAGARALDAIDPE